MKFSYKHTGTWHNSYELIYSLIIMQKDTRYTNLNVIPNYELASIERILSFDKQKH